MRFLAPPHQWFLKLTFLKIELWVYGSYAYPYFEQNFRAVVKDLAVTATHSLGILDDCSYCTYFASIDGNPHATRPEKLHAQKTKGGEGARDCD
jgi:hypothetical protein